MVHLSLQVQLQGSRIPIVQQLKYLGVTLDPQLNFDHHAQHTSTQVKQCLGALQCSLSPRANSSSFCQIYQQAILPIATYALPVTAPMLKKSWVQLEKCNRFAARLAMNDFSTSYNDLLAKLRWKSIQLITCERSACLVFKYLHSLRHYAAGDISITLPNNHYCLRERGHKLQVQIPTTFDSTLYRLFNIWNLLEFPENALEFLDNFPTFKRAVVQLNNHCFQPAILSHFPDVMI